LIITATSSSRDHERTEAIRHVVDAFRGLHGSVLRFMILLAHEEGEAATDASAPDCALDSLLVSLETRARAVGFARLRELAALIEEARAVEGRRDAIFLSDHASDATHLRRIASDLERLDTSFVGLCVEYVMERRGGMRA
jgi:hypothetical protein